MVWRHWSVSKHNVDLKAIQVGRGKKRMFQEWFYRAVVYGISLMSNLYQTAGKVLLGLYRWYSTDVTASWWRISTFATLLLHTCWGSTLNWAFSFGPLNLQWRSLTHAHPKRRRKLTTVSYKLITTHIPESFSSWHLQWRKAYCEPGYSSVSDGYWTLSVSDSYTQAFLSLSPRTPRQVIGTPKCHQELSHTNVSCMSFPVASILRGVYFQEKKPTPINKQMYIITIYKRGIKKKKF